MKILLAQFVATALLIGGVTRCNAQPGLDTIQAVPPLPGNNGFPAPPGDGLLAPPPPPEDKLSKDATIFQHFVAHNKTRTCTSDSHARPFNNQIRGVNLGGWMVLEPWITPSLFYQFLGRDEKSTAFDIYSFCSILGPVEGNRQLRRHWETWVTEDIINTLAQSNAVNSLRLPVGDYMYKPYGPYGE